jgi:hypothetical protein
VRAGAPARAAPDPSAAGPGCATGRSSFCARARGADAAASPALPQVRVGARVGAVARARRSTPDRRVEAVDAAAGEPERRAGVEGAPVPRPWRTRLADRGRATSEPQQRQGRRRKGASSDPPMPSQRTRSCGLARASGFWYSRARVKLQSGVATTPGRERTPWRVCVCSEWERGVGRWTEAALLAALLRRRRA